VKIRRNVERTCSIPTSEQLLLGYDLDQGYALLSTKIYLYTTSLIKTLYKKVMTKNKFFMEDWLELNNQLNF
jgi:hypothetical protein